jgi:hypothetical protein
MIKITKNGKTIDYHDEFTDLVDGDTQYIRLTDGCHRGCFFCYTPKTFKWYQLPPIRRNKVIFLDQNFLSAHPDPLALLSSLPEKHNKRVIRYSFTAGLDYTLLTDDIISILKKKRFGRFTGVGKLNKPSKFVNGISISWDRSIRERVNIIDVVKRLDHWGYRRKNILIRILCNYKDISFAESMSKLKTIWDLRVMVDDCYFDNYTRGTAKPIYWTAEEIKRFGDCCRSINVQCIQTTQNSIDYIIEGNYSSP